MKKTAIKKFSQNFLLYLFIIVCIALIVSCVILLNEYQNELDQQATEAGLIYSKDMAAHLDSTVESYIKRVNKLTAGLNGSFESEADFATALRPYKLDPDNYDILFTRYFKDGVMHRVDTEESDMRFESKVLIDFANEKRDYTTCAGIVADHYYKISAVPFYVPLRNNPYADAAVIYFDTDSISAFPGLHDAEEIQKSDLTAVITEDGMLISIIHENDLQITRYTTIYDELRDNVHYKTVIDDLTALIRNGESGAFPVSVYGEKYILALGGVKDDESPVPFSILSLYKAVDLYNSGYSVITTVLGVLMMFFALLIAAVIYILIVRSKAEKTMETAGDTDRKLGCPSREKFEKTASEILGRIKTSAFAIIAVDLKHFNYLSGQLSSDQLLQVLQYMKLLYSKAMQVDETYGYISNGCFVLLLHYRDKEALEKRLQGVSSMAWSYTRKLSGNLHVSLFGGIYYTNSNITTDVSKMIDLAITAKDAMNVAYDFGSFRSYNEQLHSSLVETEYIEMRMEDALANKEFKVFYQPTYNIARDAIDGCEALMRWYNPEKDTYMQPGVFLPLFEANGFMAKLDRYVFEQVCEFIKGAFDSEQKIYPVSLNISRVTASEQGFLDFYIATKRKYGIPNDYLSLEFSENFAYEDVESMRSLIAELRASGFKCCIDDFGAGTASMRILKELPVDEIKLDRSFIMPGMSADRDEKVLGSIIRTAKELKAKVSQKGVETDAQLDMLKRLGCQVTQGYHFAKPLYLTDYIDFINRRTEKPKFSPKT